MEQSTEDTDWMKFLSKSGQLLFYYNKVTAEHRWPDIYNGYENGTPIYGRSLVCVGSQTNDYGCSNGCGSVHVDGGVIQLINVKEEGTYTESSQLHEDLSQVLGENSNVVSHCANESQVMAEVIANSSLGDTTQSDVFGGSGLIQPNNVKKEATSTESWQLSQLAENVLLALGPSENTVFDSGSEMQVMAEVTEDCSVGATTQTDVFYGSSLIQSNNIKEEDPSTECPQLADNVLLALGPSENTVFDSVSEMQVMAEVTEDCSVGATTQTDVFGGCLNTNAGHSMQTKNSFEVPQNNKQRGKGLQSAVANNRPYKCKTCGKTFTHKRNLKYHEYIHSGTKPYECKTCGKRFCQQGNLKYHEYIHTGTKPYECKTCDRKFTQHGSLKCHERTHTGTKPYGCNTCGKAFAVKQNLKRHEYMHTGLKPHQCKTCGKECSQRGDLRRHECTHTGTKAYGCKTCGKRFTQQGSLRRHEYTHGDS